MGGYKAKDYLKRRLLLDAHELLRYDALDRLLVRVGRLRGGGVGLGSRRGVFGLPVGKFEAL